MSNCPSCAQPIESHDPGREHDLCIGLAKGLIIKHDDGLYSFKMEHGIHGFDYGKYTAEDIVKKPELPRYSESFAACEGLIEEMRKGKHYYITIKFMPNNTGCVAVKLSGFVEGHYEELNQFAPTLPHALSLAYLAYAGQKGGE